MKRYLISVIFIFSVLCLFGQDEYLKNKIGNAKLKQIKDKTLANYNLLKQTKGKVTIIEFWETWCGPCLQGMPHLKNLKDRFPNDLEIVCVSCDDLEKTISFIEKTKYPFTFIYDKEKYLEEKAFPHSGIPHSILVDKAGKIQVGGTLPGFITEDVINNLLNNKQINVPQKTLFNPDNLSDKKSENTLLNFELQGYQLGNRNYLQTKKESRSKRIFTDYQGEYKDTIENRTEYTAAGQNILELYQIAYENIPLTRFIYNEELNYINSQLPNHRYTMIFSSSDLLGNPNSILINQLNSIFGLKTGTKEKEVEVFILDSIRTNTDNIKRSYENSKVGMSLSTNLTEYELNATFINSIQIAKTLEDFFKIPVETAIDATNFYNVKINIKKDAVEDVSTGFWNKDVNAWLELFNENGFILRKEKKVLKFIEIEKSI